MGAEWFRRLGDMPGVDYAPTVPVDRAGIPGHDVQPEVRPYRNIRGEEDMLVSWDWGTSDWAPVRQHLERVNETTPTPQVLKRLSEALELPGEPRDYHWVLGSALERLWARRATEPEVLVTVESLAWVHVRLALAFPRECWILFRPLDESTDRYRRPAGFETLLRLYRTEGFLRIAFQVAELEARHFPVAGDELADLRSQMELVGAESGG
jgi:hypothetical protein